MNGRRHPTTISGGELWMPTPGQTVRGWEMVDEVQWEGGAARRVTRLIEVTPAAPPQRQSRPKGCAIGAADDVLRALELLLIGCVRMLLLLSAALMSPIAGLCIGDAIQRGLGGVIGLAVGLVVACGFIGTAFPAMGR